MMPRITSRDLSAVENLPAKSIETESETTQSTLFQATPQLEGATRVPAQVLEDHIQNGTTLYVHSRSPFYGELQKLSQELGIKLVALKSSFTNDQGKPIQHVWLRDYFYKGVDASGEVSISVVPDFGPKVGEFVKSNRLTTAFAVPGIKPICSTYEKDSEYGFFSEFSLARAQQFSAEESSRLTEELKALSAHPEFVRQKTTSLEGGNLIATRNQQGELVYLIGESAVVHASFFEALFLNPQEKEDKLRAFGPEIEGSFQREAHGSKKWFDHFMLVKKGDAVGARALAEQRMASKYALSYELNAASQGEFQRRLKENVTVVPQCFYHIDLQMAYVGNGRVLMHSFQKTVEFLNAHRDQILQELSSIDLGQIGWRSSPIRLFDHLVEFNTFLAKELESTVVDKASQKLEKHGLEVHKCCGNLFYKSLEHGIPSGLLGCLMNGISGHSEATQENYFVTAASILPSFDEQFKATLSESGVQQCYFLNSSTAEGKEPNRIDTVNFINRTHGSVRCQTNTNLDV